MLKWLRELALKGWLITGRICILCLKFIEFVKKNIKVTNVKVFKGTHMV
jgi:hypothetical protein